MLFRTLGTGAVIAVVACASAGVPRQPAQASAPRTQPGAYPHSAADVEFMSGMIPHHAQAVVMGRDAIRAP